MIHKSSHSRGFDYSRNFYAKDADVLAIMLPVVSDGSPAYDYMEDVVRTLEAERVRTLEAYLKVGGLSHCVLTSEEELAYNSFSTRRFLDFVVVGGEGGLFVLQTPKKKFDANKIILGDVGYPYVVRSAQNKRGQGVH